jgi:cellulose synthase operon protein C
MPRPRSLIAALLAAATSLHEARGAPSDDAGLVARLARNAWYWQARARSDKAEEAWKQVLEAAPDNPEALAALGGFHARAGRMQAARDALARLEKTSPGHPDVPVLRREIEVGARYGALLSQARKLVHEDRLAEGAAKYRELFGAAGPPGDLALEYYQTVGGTPGGWEEARDGLRRVVRRAPGEPRFRLALGKLLTYREETRREGIELLAALARDPTVGKEASASWRQALLWLPATEADVPLLRAYTKAHPGDAEIARRIDRSRKSGSLREAFGALDRGDLRTAEQLFRAMGDDPEARRGLALIAERRSLQTRKAGFAALDRGDLKLAEELFQAAGDDPDARLGLALVAQRRGVAALQEGNFPEAREDLERARRLQPQRRDLWEEPLRSATFWELLQEARAARDDGRDEVAEAKLLEALAHPPVRDRWHADMALADLYLARKQRQKAEARYREVLAAVPDQPDALRALVTILVQDGRYDEAAPVNDRLLHVDARKAFRPQWLRAETLRAAAARSRASGDPARARAQLAEARQSDPTDVWVLHDLANVLLETGSLADAQPVVAELLRAAPSLPEARVVEARLLSARGDAAGALDVLGTLPPPRDPAVVALRRRLEIQVEIPQLLDLAARGGRAEAVQRLTALERSVAREPELAARVAVAWSKLGENQRALTLMRSAVAKAPGATRGARIELASALLEAGDDDAVSRMISGLEQDPSLTPAERRSLAEIRIVHAVRIADRTREAGNTAAAALALDSVEKDYPRDPRVLAARARLLESSDPARARALFRAVLAASPDDVEALRGSIDTSLALGDLDQARALAGEMERRHPVDPRVHIVAARVALQRGDDGAAMESLRTARMLLAPRLLARGAAVAAVGTSAAQLPPGEPALASASDGGQDAMRADVDRQIQRIQDRHRSAFSAGGEARLRDGEPGLSSLTELRQSVQFELPIAYRGRASLRVAEVELDAGLPAPDAEPRFGTGGTTRTSQRAMGTELFLSYQERHFAAFVGTTPIGFRLLAGLGGIRAQDSFGPLSVGAELSRRILKESLLSYAGTFDPATRRTWGGVLMDGGRLDLALGFAPATFYAYGELHRLIGYQVHDNLRMAAGGGIDLQLYRGIFGNVVAGPAVALMAYDRNLRFFTFGQGGYFSPQRFVHGGLALKWWGGERFRWELLAEPGYDAFSEDSSPAFPLSTDQQGVDPYPARTSGGLSFNGRASIGWRISSAFELGLNVTAQRAPQFQELSGGLFLRFGGSAR